MTSTSAGPDVSVGPQSCLVRLVGLLLSWVSLVYRSSVFAVGRSGRFGGSLILLSASCWSSQLGIVGLPLLDVRLLRASCFYYIYSYGIVYVVRIFEPLSWAATF